MTIAKNHLLLNPGDHQYEMRLARVIDELGFEVLSKRATNAGVEWQCFYAPFMRATFTLYPVDDQEGWPCKKREVGCIKIQLDSLPEHEHLVDPVKAFRVDAHHKNSERLKDRISTRITPIIESMEDTIGPVVRNQEQASRGFIKLNEALEVFSYNTSITLNSDLHSESLYLQVGNGDFMDIVSDFHAFCIISIDDGLFSLSCSPIPTGVALDFVARISNERDLWTVKDPSTEVPQLSFKLADAQTDIKQGVTILNLNNVRPDLVDTSQLAHIISIIVARQAQQNAEG